MPLFIPVVPYQSSEAQLSSGNLAGLLACPGVTGVFLKPVLPLAEFGRARSSDLEIFNLGPIDIWTGYFFAVGLSCASQGV